MAFDSGLDTVAFGTFNVASVVVDPKVRELVEVEGAPTSSLLSCPISGEGRLPSCHPGRGVGVVDSGPEGVERSETSSLGGRWLDLESEVDLVWP